MKRALFSSFDMARITEFGKRRPSSETMGESTPLPAIFAPFLNISGSSRRSSNPASREHIIPFTVEPRSSTTLNKVNFQSQARSEDRSVGRTTETPSRTGRTSVRMSTNDHGMEADDSSNMASNITATSDATQSTDFSETGQMSHSESLRDKSKDTAFGRSDGTGALGPRLLRVCVCILALVVMAVLVPFVFSTSSRSTEHLYADTRQATEVDESTTLPNIPPRPPKPVSGQLGAPCSDSSSCLGEALCMYGVCRCEGPDLRVVKGTCVAAVTTEIEEPPLSEKPTTTSRHSSTENLQPFAGTVRLGTSNKPNASESEPASFEEDSEFEDDWSQTSSTETLRPVAVNTRLGTFSTRNKTESEPATFEADSAKNMALVNETVVHEEGSPGTEGSNSTDDLSEPDEQERQRQPEEASVMDF
ncbi:hypothetical protein MTO96_008962 [Rhipicephalus appendiculatus]